MTALLTEAFRALGAGANKHQVRLVVDTLIKSGDEETLDVLDEATCPTNRSAPWPSSPPRPGRVPS